MKNKERKSIQLELAKENIDFFFNLLENSFNPEFDKFYIREIQRLSQGFNIRLTRENKLKFCRKCLTYHNSKTREIRFNSKTKSKEYICKICNSTKRIKYKK